MSRAVGQFAGCASQRSAPLESICRAPQRKPVVIVTRKLPDVVEMRMCELFDTTLNVEDKPMSPQELVEAVKKADVLVPDRNG